VVNKVVVWLHILGPYWCLCVVLFGSSRLMPNRTILMDNFNNYNFSKHKLMRSLMMA